MIESSLPLSLLNLSWSFSLLEGTRRAAIEPPLHPVSSRGLTGMSVASCPKKNSIFDSISRDWGGAVHCAVPGVARIAFFGVGAGKLNSRARVSTP